MQNMVKKIVLMSIMVSICNPLKATSWWNEPGHHWLEIATVVGMVCAAVPSSSIYWAMKKNNKAEALKEERLLLDKKREIEVENNRRDAKMFMNKLRTRYGSEFSYIKENGNLTKEVVVNGAKQHADQTPFYYIRYSKKLKKAAEKLCSLRNLLSESKQKKAEKMISWMKLMRESNNIFCQDKLAVQHEEKREAKQQQQIFDLKKAAKEEKLKGRQVETKASEESLNAVYRAKKANESFVQQAHAVLNSVLNRANESHAVLLNEYSKHGWNALAQRMNCLENSLNKNQKIGHEDKEKINGEIKNLKKDMEALLDIIAQSNSTNELKKEVESLKAALNQRIGNLEVTLATMTVSIEDIKTIVTGPRAPEF